MLHCSTASIIPQVQHDFLGRNKLYCTAVLYCYMKTNHSLIVWPDFLGREKLYCTALLDQYFIAALLFSTQKVRPYYSTIYSTGSVLHCSTASIIPQHSLTLWVGTSCTALQYCISASLQHCFSLLPLSLAVLHCIITHWKGNHSSALVIQFP